MELRVGIREALLVVAVAALAPACSGGQPGRPGSGGSGVGAGAAGGSSAGMTGAASGTTGGAAGTAAAAGGTTGTAGGQSGQSTGTGAAGGVAAGAGGAVGPTGGSGGDVASTAGGGNGGRSGTAGAGGARTGAGGAVASGGVQGSGGNGPPGCNAAGQWEPNDVIGQACPISLKTMVESTLGTGDTDDYYSFAVQAGQRFAVNFWNTTPASNTVYVAATLVTAGQMVPSLNDSGVGANSAFYFELPATMAGTMVLRIHQSAAITYKLSVVSCADPGQDPVTFEPNNTACSAAPLTLGTNIETQLAPPEDIDDYFTIPVTKSSWYAFTFGIAASNPRLYLSADLNPEGGKQTAILPQAGYEAGTSFKEFQAPSTGAVVFDFKQTGSTIYDFVVYPSTADGLVHDAKYEPNNTPHTAAPLPLGQQVSSDMNAATDAVDNFQVNVQGGVPYVATFSNTAAAGWINFSIYTLEGVALVNPVNVVQNSLNAQFPFTPQADGVVVVTLQTAQTITYTLQVTAQ